MPEQALIQGRLILKKFKEIALEVGAYLMADIAHIAGLVVAGLHPSPVLYADVITTTTQNTKRTSWYYFNK